MEGFYLILIIEVLFSAAVSVGLICFVRKVRASHSQEVRKREKEMGILENLVNVQDKVLDVYRSTPTKHEKF
jgi:hypothetical protein